MNIVYIYIPPCVYIFCVKGMVAQTKGGDTGRNTSTATAGLGPPFQTHLPTQGLDHYKCVKSNNFENHFIHSDPCSLISVLRHFPINALTLQSVQTVSFIHRGETGMSIQTDWKLFQEIKAGVESVADAVSPIQISVCRQLS